ncbi:MAG TPA: hypothetical protein VF335_09325, partial [Chitinivibrionales bacterium]
MNLSLKYGCNPHQTNARLVIAKNPSPLEILNGALTENYLRSQYLDTREYSPVANAYIRARGGDRMCSYGDAAAVSRSVDAGLAAILKTEVCDSIIAPAYEPEALRILKTKKNGSFLIFKIDPNYKPGEIEKRELFGFTLEQ